MKTILLGCTIMALTLAFDLLWFQVAGDFFKNQIGSIIRMAPDGRWQVSYIPALLVYLCMAVGLLVFVLPYASNISHALLLGGIFGFVVYGVYDLTNLATLSAWTVRFVAVDMLWGTALCSVVAGASFWLSRFPFFNT